MKYRIVVLGDICPGWGYPELFSTGNPERVFHDILPLLKDADYVVANLECPVTNSTEKLNKNSINLKSKPSDVDVLQNAGIHGFGLANNHVLDYGEKGLIDTLDYLSKRNIKYYGVDSIDNASNPLVLNFNSLSIGFLAFAEQEFNCAVDYGIGASKWDDIDSIDIIKKAKEKCDFLILQYHGGIENYKYPSPLLQKKCRAMAEAGADFITCQHSHVIGTREKWKDKEILYGHGNTIFGYSKEGGDDWNNGMICVVDLEYDKDGVSSNINYLPIIASQNGEFLAKGDIKDNILSSFANESLNIKNPEFIRNQWVSFCRHQKNVYLPMLFAWPKGLIRANKILGGGLITALVGKKQRRNAMNLIRCDAHREVVSTILTEDYYSKDAYV